MLTLLVYSSRSSLQNADAEDHGNAVVGQTLLRKSHFIERKVAARGSKDGRQTAEDAFASLRRCWLEFRLVVSWNAAAAAAAAAVLYAGNSVMHM